MFSFRQLPIPLRRALLFATSILAFTSACTEQQDLGHRPDRGESTSVSGSTSTSSSSGTGGGSTSSSSGTGGSTSSSSGTGGCIDQCTLGATQCSGSGVQTCATQPSGCTDWGSASACPVSCLGGACACDQCYAGQTSCAGGLLTTCVLSNGCYTWDAGTACPGSQSCVSGVCALGAVTIVQDTVLCGDLFYSGPFAIAGGATVTCPSGVLSIHAPSISIDPSSKIDLSATSTTPGGADGIVFSGSGSFGYTAGGGGGYGTVGGQGWSNLFANSGSLYCTQTYGAGPVYGSLYDIFVVPGSTGGKGLESTFMSPPPGGNGGGSVSLLATTQVSVLGKILVNGGNANTVATYLPPGGGSGGGVLVMAPTVNLGPTSLLSAAGGNGGTDGNFCIGPIVAGNGGLGRIKILYGDTFTSQGTVTGDPGSNSITWMPPASITSSSYPSQTLWYNDGLTQPFTFTWQKPFAGAFAYYYAFTSDPAFQLTPGNGTLTLGTSATFPASQVTGSPMYFYVLTVDGSVTASTVANRFTVQLNSATYNLSSPNRPDQNAWYAPSVPVVMTWAPPSGIPASSFQGFYYRVDHASNTAPPDLSQPVVGWTATTSTSALLQTDSQGNALQNGTYYFHLVAQDTMGNSTKVAAHYRIQLGPEPPTTLFFGYVTTSAGAAIAGATVRLEPYGLTMPTDANGYFTFSNVYQMGYAFSATKQGYSPASIPVTVTPSASPFTVIMSP